MAHLVDSEGCEAILSRWDTEKTSLVSDGYDRRSNLDMSIALSLSSPRLASVSGAQDLLSLLSMLPDGISDVELGESKFSIPNILECKAALLRTSLAYNSSQKRLKILVPIQEYMQQYHPVQLVILEPLFQYYRELLELYNKHKGSVLAEIMPQIRMNFANIQSLISFKIRQEQLDHSQAVYSALYLNTFSRKESWTVIPLMDLVAANLPTPVDHRLEVYFLSEFFNVRYTRKDPGAEDRIQQAFAHFPYINDSNVKCKCFNQFHLLRFK